MAIRFSCPSCQQPIEVDDAWGGSSVACPYCRKVVVAPRENAWPTGEIPVASPAQTGFAPPPPPPGYRNHEQLPEMHAVPTTGRTRPSSANWALLLAVAGAILTSLALFIWMSVIFGMAMQKTGAAPSQEQLSQAVNEIIIARSTPASPAAATMLFVGAFCGITGLALAIRSLVRNEGNTIKAITACLLGGISVFCQLGLMMAMAGGSGGTP